MADKDFKVKNGIEVGGNAVISGNLTVSGTTTTINTETVTVNDNIIVLNNNATGTPSENAGVEVERGDSTNASILWDESTDKWKAGLVGSESEIIDASSTGQTKTGNFTSSGDITAGGLLKSTQSLTNEGGEIQLSAPSSGSTLNGPIIIDIYQNKLRFFENGGTARGYYIDLTTGGAGAGTNLVGGGSGTVTSVDMTVPTGLTVSGNPITTTGTLAVTLTAGYSIPTTSSQTNWDTAYTDRLKWDGGSTGLTASTGRTSLGLGTMATETAADYAKLGSANAFTVGGHTITNTVAATIPLSITGAASQSVDLFRILDSGLTARFRVLSGGRTFINPASSGDVPLTLRGAASQTANLQEWQNSSGGVNTQIGPDGTLSLRTNSSLNPSILVGTTSWLGAEINVQPYSATRIGAIIRGAASQTANLQEWQDSAGTVGTRIAANGTLYASQVLTQRYVTDQNNTTPYLDFNANKLTVNARSAGYVGLIVQGAASQTANLQEWQTSAGTVVGAFENSGTMRATYMTDAANTSTAAYFNFTTTAVGLYSRSAGNTVSFIRGAVSQTGNLQEWQDNSATIMSKVSADGTGTFSNLVVTGNLTVNGTTTTINSTTVSVDDKNIELGSVATPTDTTADGGGITLKGATDKTITWSNTSGYWTFSHSISAPSFVKTGGTSSQFLKADGSVDSSTYLTSYTETDPVFVASEAYTITATDTTNWDSAYTDRMKWDGGSTGLVAATGRTSLGATTVGSNLFTLTNPSAITFLRVNADNTVSTLDAATFRTAIGAGTSSTTGTVTSIATSTGLTGGTITTTGTLSIDTAVVPQLAAANAFTGANTFTNGSGITVRNAATQDGIIIDGRAGGTTSLAVSIVPTTLTASRTLTLPDVTGTVVTTGDTGSVTNTMLAGSIAITKLASSTISGVSLGNNLNSVTFNNGGAGGASGSTYNGSSTLTVSYNTVGAAASGHNHTLDSLSNVTITSNASGEILKWNGSAWINNTLTEAGIMSNPMTTLGDIIYTNATPAPARLAGNTTTTKQFLSQTGTGTVSAAPAWGALAVADIPTLTSAKISDLTLSGATTIGSSTHTVAFTTSGNTSVALPTSGTLVNSAVATLSSLASVGTITTGTWNGSTIAYNYGGTGLTSYAKGDIIYASAANTLAKLAVPATNGYLLTYNSTTGLPQWSAPSGGTGTVTEIVAGTGLTGGTITTSGTIAIDTATVTTLTGTQTLTNKTLTTPVINSISASASSSAATLWSTLTTGSITIGGSTTTGSVIIGNSANTSTQTISITTGATASTSTATLNLLTTPPATGGTRTINIGTGAASAGTSTVNIMTGPTAGVNNVNIGSSQVNVTIAGNLSATSSSAPIDAPNGPITTGTQTNNPSASGGVYLGSAGKIHATVNGGTVMQLNRNTSDGEIVGLYQAQTLEGSISVSGTTVTYGSFAGTHWSQFSNNERPDILPGTILENTGEMCEWAGEENEQLTRVKISDTEDSSGVYGVFMRYDNDDQDYPNDVYVLALGAWMVRVDADEVVFVGDLLSSKGNGCAKVQDDDIIRSKTIGKVTSAIPVTVYSDGSKLIPCVLYCG